MVAQSVALNWQRVVKPSRCRRLAPSRLREETPFHSRFGTLQVSFFCILDAPRIRDAESFIPPSIECSSMKYVIPIVVLLSIAVIWFSWESDAKPTGDLNPSSKAEPVSYKELPRGYEAVEGNFRLMVRRLSGRGPAEEGQSLFERVTDSGIEFANDYKLRENEQNVFMETGSGVAIGDFDNDGLNDVYMVGADIGNRLYKNIGNMKFRDMTEKANVGGDGHIGSGATFADVDNDGFLDLFVCNMGGPNLMYMNQGDGTFIEQAHRRGLNYIGASKVGSFCDYDNDGDLDIYLLTYQDESLGGKQRIAGNEYYADLEGKVVIAGEKDIFYRNNGDGTFEDYTEVSGIFGFAPGLSAQWMDYNDDGWQDIYVTTDFHLTDRLYENQGDGRFKDVISQVVKRTPWYSMGMDSGDLNGDGMVDFLIADMAGSSHFKQKVDMGEMLDANWFLTSGDPRQAMKNCLYINSGTGPFFEASGFAGLTSTDWTWAIRFVDLDSDGKLDVYMTTGHARDSMNSDILTQVKEKKGEYDSFEKIPVRNDRNRAFKNNGGLQFENVSENWGLDHLGVSHGAAFSDLDNDGDMDLIVSNYYENALIYRNQSAERASVIFEFRGKENNFYGVGTKVELFQGEEMQVRTLTPTRGYISSDAPQVHLGVADAPIDKVVVTWSDGSQQEFTDLEPNCCYRVIESENRERAGRVAEDMNPLFKNTASSRGIKFVHREREFDDYAREPLLPYKLSELGGGVAWGDVNGDGKPDLYCGGAAGQVGELYVNAGEGKFNSVNGPWANHGAFEDMGVLFFDFDGDGDQDLYVASGSNECKAGDKLLVDRLYVNDGSEKFSIAPAGTLPEIFNSGSSVSAADYDKDGDLDLFVGSRSVPGKYPLTPESSLLENRDGKFVVVTDDIADGLKSIGLVNSAIWSDFNSDGWPDLILALDWGPPTFFENQNGKLVDRSKKLGVADSSGWWRGIERADLDDDGDLDYVFTNQGTNTKYHADMKHPHRLYYSDFDNNGTMDLVEAEFEGETEFPVRGRSCSSETMPFIADKFKDFKGFAAASLTEIYEDSIHEKDVREVTELHSSILWNEGGSFRVETMETMAQLSPTFSALAKDFDLNGTQDIFLANNFFASQPETGYMDGGMSLFVSGQADGGFKSVWPNKSGVRIHEASYAAATADMDGDGDLDIAVGVNNGRVRLLENQSDVKDSVRVELPADSVGMQILLKGDGFQRRIEIGSNNGYLAQSWNSEIILAPAIATKVKEIQVGVGDDAKTVAFEPESGRVKVE